jgi:hypothetical protein
MCECLEVKPVLKGLLQLRECHGLTSCVIVVGVMPDAFLGLPPRRRDNAPRRAIFGACVVFIRVPHSAV